MKRFSLCLFLVIFAGIIGVFGNGQMGDSNDTQKLVIWHQADEPVKLEAFEVVVAEFLATHPGVEIEHQVMEMENMKQSMATAVPSGLGPDIFASSIGAYLWPVIDAGLLMDLSDAYDKYGWEERLVDWSKPYTMYKDKYWSIPNEAEIVSVIFYNKDIFSENGFSVPETWNEFITLCEKFKALGYEMPVTAPGGVPLFNAHWEAMVYGCAVDQEVLDDTVFRDGNWNQSDYIDAVSMIKDMNDRKVWGENINAIQYGEAQSLFYTGQSPMWLNGTWALNGLVADFGMNFDFFVPPPVDGIEGRAAINCGSGWQVSSASRNPDLAVEFLDFVISQQAEKIWLENCQWIPPTNIDANAVELNEYQKKVIEIIAVPEAAYSMYNVVPSEVNQPMWAVMQEMYLGKATPEDVLVTKQEYWDTAVTEGRISSNK